MAGGFGDVDRRIAARGGGSVTGAQRKLHLVIWLVLGPLAMAAVVVALVYTAGSVR